MPKLFSCFISEPLFKSNSMRVRLPLKEAKWRAENPSSSVLKFIHSLIWELDKVLRALVTRAVAMSSRLLKQAK